MNLNHARGFVGSRINQLTAPIQQIKAAGLSVRGQTTQGLPQPVRNVQVSITADGDNRILRVSFIQNANDPYFTDADLYIKQGNNNPTLIAMGTSPIIVTVAKSTSPTTVIVASSGNWGTTPLSVSPSKAVSLA